MFHAPTTQGMGAFRTLGELNSCEGDPASHFSFGLGFFFNAWASSVAAGAFTQDVDHRIIPNWGAAALMIKNRNVGETLHDPRKMAIACGVIGMLVVTFLNLTASSVPAALQVTAVKVLVPAANLLVNTVMPVIFWLAAIDAGKKSGFWATIFGGAAQLIMGNAVPGLVLGILIGKGVEESGWNHVTKVMMAAIVLLFVLSGFFRGFDMKMIESFHLTVPNWLDMIHNSLSGFWYADWSFPIFVGLLSSGVFAGTHMYYLYGIGAFNEVAFVAMLKAGIDTGVYGAVAAFGASFLFARIIEGSLVGILDIGGAIQTGVGLGVPALLLGAGIMFPVTNFIASLITGLVIGLAIGYVIILARKFTINQSNSTYGADVMMGAGNASGRFLGPLIILSAMTASIPIGVGSLVGALLFYIWQKPITGGAILGAMILGWLFPVAL
ncbi:hypothetical protein ID866_2039 [Astraeus odoratus]|nr:hypothetical protein ID866_2039 [Astraeus odoratus]